jgi:hypothetical protein
MSDFDVVLTTNNPQAEILLINSRFKLVARGASPLQEKVPAGIYSMKVRVGDEEREELFSVRPDEAPPNNAPFTRHVAAPAFSSAIPLADTATTHEYHQAAASKYLANDAPTIHRGEGASIMVCVRDPARLPIDQERDRYARNFSGFRLLDAQGAVVVDFDLEGERNVDARYMAARVNVAPGSYALAYERGDARLCLPLPTALRPAPSPTWILQAYVPLVPVATGSIEMRPDFRDVAMAFGRTGEGFQPHRFDWQVMETVRKGLIDGRNYVGTSTMQDMLLGKFENPILGLYGAHLLLLDPKADPSMIETVIVNSSRMLGENYPDVVALAWACTHQTTRPLPQSLPAFKDVVGRVPGPPLLSRSWEPLVNALRETDPVACANSPVMRVAPNLVASKVFLSWQGKAASVEHAPMEPASASNEAAPSEASPSRAPKVLIPILLRAAGTLVVGLLKGMRDTIGAYTSSTDPLPVAKIEEIKDTTEAAAVLQWIARNYDWARILPEVKREAAWMSNLTGLQRDLFLLMRLSANDPEAIAAITPAYVERLLETYRVPLPTLAQSLTGLEFGGYWSTALQKFLQAAKQSKQPA